MGCCQARYDYQNYQFETVKNSSVAYSNGLKNNDYDDTRENLNNNPRLFKFKMKIEESKKRNYQNKFSQTVYPGFIDFTSSERLEKKRNKMKKKLNNSCIIFRHN